MELTIFARRPPSDGSAGGVAEHGCTVGGKMIKMGGKMIKNPWGKGNDHLDHLGRILK
jgi:hypothetical protein